MSADKLRIFVFRSFRVACEPGITKKAEAVPGRHRAMIRAATLMALMTLC